MNAQDRRIPEEKRKRIETWLASPAASDFISCLEAEIAFELAIASNSQLKSEEQDKLTPNAAKSFHHAKKLQSAIDVFIEHSKDTTKLITVEIKP